MVVIVVTDTGRVSQRVAFLAEELSEQSAAQVKTAIAQLVTGKPVGDAAAAIAELAASVPAGTRIDDALRVVARIVGEELDDFRQDRLVMAGSATLARRESDFRGSIYPLLEAIEEQVTLLRLMGEMVADEHGLAASIGRENAAFGLTEASVLTSDYDTTGTRARVGLLGPTRMDYPTNLAAVRAVAHYLSRLLDEDDASR